MKYAVLRTAQEKTARKFRAVLSVGKFELSVLALTTQHNEKAARKYDMLPLK